MAAALLPAAWPVLRAFPQRRGAVLLCLTACALVNGSRAPVVRHLTIPLDKLPVEASGFTLVQLSDLHLGRLRSLDRLRVIVALVNGLAPDLVVVTGDLADPDVGGDAEFCRELRAIRARHGVVAVPGNHDHHAGIDRFLRVAGSRKADPT